MICSCSLFHTTQSTVTPQEKSLQLYSKVWNVVLGKTPPRGNVQTVDEQVLLVHV